MTVLTSDRLVLSVLRAFGAQSVAEMASRTGVSEASVYGALKRLRTRGLVVLHLDGPRSYWSAATTWDRLDVDGGTSRGQYTDKGGNPLDADELAKRLGR
jgi:DNA-binding transcriptional ArsR family regulator